MKVTEWMRGNPRAAWAIGAFILGMVLGMGLMSKAHAQVGNNLSVNPLLASSAHTAATVNTTDQTNTSWARAQIVINVSAWTSGTYTPTLQGKDPVSGNYYTILAGSAISSLPAAPVIMRVGAGFPETANVSTGNILPRVWRVTFAGTSTPSMTFSVGAFLAP